MMNRKLSVASSQWSVVSGQSQARRTPDSGLRTTNSVRAFTLIEVMVVVAIMAIVMAMGVPSIIRALRKEGMRKAVSDVVEVCSNARAAAILRGDTVELVFRSEDNGFSVQSVGGSAGGKEASSREENTGAGLSAQLPEGIGIAELKVNGLDYMEATEARVHFYPNGTCDDFTISLLSEKREIRRITLEITTGLAEVEVMQ